MAERCQAKISTVHNGGEDYRFHLKIEKEGKQQSLGQDLETEDWTTYMASLIECASCHISGQVSTGIIRERKQSEALNAKQVEEFIKNNCKRLTAFGYQQIPPGWIPSRP